MWRYCPPGYSQGCRDVGAEKLLVHHISSLHAVSTLHPRYQKHGQTRFHEAGSDLNGELKYTTNEVPLFCHVYRLSGTWRHAFYKSCNQPRVPISIATYRNPTLHDVSTKKWEKWNNTRIVSRHPLATPGIFLPPPSQMHRNSLCFSFTCIASFRRVLKRRLYSLPSKISYIHAHTARHLQMTGEIVNWRIGLRKLPCLERGNLEILDN